MARPSLATLVFLVLPACVPSAAAAVDVPGEEVVVADESTESASPIASSHLQPTSRCVRSPSGPLLCLTEQARPWADAEMLCRLEHGGRLARVDDPATGQFVTQAFGAPMDLSTGLWFGLEEPREGTWAWANGVTPEAPNWAPGEPNNSGGRENCAEWRPQTGQWNDLNCETPRGFVCEPGNWESAFRCEGHARNWSGQSVCVYDTLRVEYREARAFCQERGGQLATRVLQDPGLSGAVALGSTPTRVWIGATDMLQEGRYVWSDGVQVDHGLWRAGEPNDAGGAEDCVEWSPFDAQWNDAPCATPLASLCEVPSGNVRREAAVATDPA